MTRQFSDRTEAFTAALNPGHRCRTSLAVFVTAPLPLCAYLVDTVALPLVDGDEPPKLDEKRCSVIDILTLTLQTCLVGLMLRLPDTLARRRFRIDVHHVGTIGRTHRRALPS
ncbi:hypothetical protein AWC03_23455 [Mycobacterium europaeum]|nr:hypothetical protein AWC03_23455 [Mycobacterium europaeum]